MGFVTKMTIIQLIGIKLRQHNGCNLKIFLNRKKNAFGHHSHGYGGHSGKYLIVIRLQHVLGKSLFQELISTNTSPYCFVCPRFVTPDT